MLYISSSAFSFDVLETPEAAPPPRARGIELTGGSRHHPIADLSQRLARLRDKGVALLFHNYFPIPEKSFVLNFASARRDVLEASFSLAETALDLCARFDVPYYSFHPGYLYDAEEAPDGQFVFVRSGGDYGQALDRFHAAFDRLYAMAATRGVRLVLENLFLAPDLRTSLNVTFAELEDILAPLPKDVGLLLDLGHLNIAASTLGFDRIDYLRKTMDGYGDRVVELHLSANDGITDQHLPLESDDWQLEALHLFARPRNQGAPRLNVTLESRRLDPSRLARSAELVDDAMRRSGLAPTE